MDNVRKKEIRDRAERLRNNLRTGRYGIVDLFKECEGLGYRLVRYPISENSVLGFSTMREGDTVIFTNSSVRLSREIFTLAHEMGHICMHLSDNKQFIDDVKTISEKEDDELEREANYFAVSLLMPRERVSSFVEYELEDNADKSLSAIDVARLMSEFGVSFEMAVNTLNNYELISAAARNLLLNQKNEIKVSNLLKSVGGNNRLNNSSMEINIPYEYIKYALYNYNNNAIPKETLVRVLDYCKISLEDIEDQLTHYERKDSDLEMMIGRLSD